MALSEKLLEVQQELHGKLVFDSSNPHYKNEYLSLGGITDALLPVLQGKGILLTQFLAQTFHGLPAITTRFTLVENGEEIEATVPLVLAKDDPQAAGSAITYFRRYSILSALGLVADEDDDANGAIVAEPASGFMTAGKKVSF